MILCISFCIQKERYCKVHMIYPEVCLLFKNNAICEHTLKLASEAPVCLCPLILSTIGIFSKFHFVESDVLILTGAYGGRETPILLLCPSFWC